MDRRQPPDIDENQIKITLPVAISFALGLAFLVSGILIYYFNGQVTLEARIKDVEAATGEIPAVKTKVENFAADIANINKALTILLIDRGYDPTKVLTSKATISGQTIYGE